MRDYLDMDVASSESMVLPLNEVSETERMTRQDRKIFRRKAARGQGNVTMSMNAPVRNLPASLPAPWDRLHRVKPGLLDINGGPAALVSLFREDPAARAFDLLRTRLMQTLRARGWSRVAIAAPTSGCGATFTAVNLALSLARVPETRTVLMDMNRRNPGVANALGLQGVGDMEGFLRGDVATGDHLVRCSEGLALGLADGPDRNAAETLHDPRCAHALDEMMLSLNPDVVLYDLPPILSFDDAAAFLPQVDALLLVADGTKTTAAQIRSCEDLLGDQGELLGVVLNQARNSH
ncbi:CpsD/CapB family tyrosine-protein kinase [Antarcticimicrobium sediminis]|uniref:Exopolysaccharide biosynthesis protein n=1 Tax=Antarcticimicrobium sediminis TaxID=2546227 RepID=A0A4R5EM07_9RHOB|nr:CpsD/CapB family tyrosine-protein kinase [Antarcticimicrobium sediminis]TDE35582.1 exopolysaccharide biosynthesis protein [Antarcticimicrobium sediminis]